MRTNEILLLLKARRFVFDRGLGQHFLRDDGVLRAIAERAGLSEDARVLEIGPGAGVLTTYLCQHAGQVLAIEVDRGLLPVLETVLGGFRNARVVREDILRADIAALARETWGPGAFDVVANLPYQITTPVLTRLLREDLPIRQATLMIQREAAERLMARPGSRAYGPLAVLAAYRARAEVVLAVPPACFVPPPAVESVVVRLELLPQTLDAEEEERLFSLVRMAFGMRRKTLRNNLGALGLEKAALDEILAACGLGEKTRAEEVSLEQFLELMRRTTGGSLGSGGFPSENFE